MILAIAFAAAIGIVPDVYTDDEGCRWMKKPDVQATIKKPRPFVVQFVQPAASAPAVKPKAKRLKPLPKSDFDLVGCDEMAPPPSITQRITTVQLEPVIGTPVATCAEDYCWLPLGRADYVPTLDYPAQPLEDFQWLPPGSSLEVPPSVIGGVPIGVPVITSSAPEPPAWAMALAGLGVLLFATHKTGQP